MKKASFIIGILFVILLSCNKKPNNSALATSGQNDFKFKVETVVDGLEVPWSMAFLPDGAMLITEQKGELIYFKNGVRKTIEDVPKVYFKGQGGLLDIELDPAYDKNGWLYLCYSSDLENDNKGGNTTIMRAKLSNNKLIEKKVLYKATPNTTKGAHFGSRI